MAFPAGNLDEMYARLALEEEEEDGVVVAENEIQQNKQAFVVIGRFFTRKKHKFCSNAKCLGDPLET